MKKLGAVVVLAADLTIDGRTVAKVGARLIGGIGWVVFNGRPVRVETMTVEQEAAEVERKATAREEEYQEAKS